MLATTEVMISPEKEGVVGIDLGTTHSLVAVSREGDVRILPLGPNGSPLVPSLFAWNGSHVLCGFEAATLRQQTPKAVLSSIKRLMGGQVGADTFSHKQDPTRGLVLSIGEKTWTPVEISAALLADLRENAANHLGYPVTQAVITVPAYFDETARQATRQAAHLAGLKVLRLLSEPTSAALAYGLGQKLEGLWGVFDLGGGTFDFSLLKMEKGIFQVLATAGDLALGGDDFDCLIARHRIGEWENLDILTRLKEIKKAQEIKENLSFFPEFGGLNRVDFELLIAPLIQRMMDHVFGALTDAFLSPQDIQGIILVGGATRIPLIQKELTRIFGQAPLCSLDPDQVVAYGAALQAEALTTGGRHLLLDVTPLSLGIEVLGGHMERLIHRNTRIPVSVTQTFTTSSSGQTVLRIHALQGESDQIKECRSLAQFTLKDIPPLSTGHPRIDVTFALDTDGLLTVSAHERISNKRQVVEVKPTYGLTVDMIRDILLTEQRLTCETS